MLRSYFTLFYRFNLYCKDSGSDSGIYEMVITRRNFNEFISVFYIHHRITSLSYQALRLPRKSHRQSGGDDRTPRLVGGGWLVLVGGGWLVVGSW